jgi:hypothetical protein
MIATSNARYRFNMSAEREPTRPQPPTGLCATCAHARQIESARGSLFFLCQLSSTDPCFPKYPRLPVLACPGYAPNAPPATGGCPS